LSLLSCIILIILQKLWMRDLPTLSLIGGPVPTGQVVVVTGPTSGIGRETAAALAARGAHGEEQFGHRCAAAAGLSTFLRLPHLLPLPTPPIALHAVILACRSVQRGKDLKTQLEEEARAAGQPRPQLEVSRWHGGHQRVAAVGAAGRVAS